MESKRAVVTGSSTPNVQPSRGNDIMEDEEQVECSHLSRLCCECTSLFRLVAQALIKHHTVDEAKRAALISLQRSYSRVKIWSDQYGVSNGGLDALFSNSRELQRDTAKLITSISATLTEGLVPFTQTLDELSAEKSRTISEGANKVSMLTETFVIDGSDDSTVSDYSHDDSGEELYDMIEDLETDTICLLDLGRLFDSPVWDVEAQEIASGHDCEIRPPHQLYAENIRTMFPNANDTVVDRLARANYDRFWRCHKVREKEASDKLAMLSTVARTSTIGLVWEKMPTEGSSLLSASSIALAIEAICAEKGRTARVPALPPRARSNKPFICVACGKILFINNSITWKQHIYDDLCPWVCLEPECSEDNPVFSTAENWTDHLGVDHGSAPSWAALQCPLCLDSVGPGELVIKKHLGSHLEEISLAALPSDPEFDAASGSQDPTGSRTDTLSTSWADIAAFEESSSGQKIGSSHHHGQGPSLDDALQFIHRSWAALPVYKYHTFIDVLKAYDSQMSYEDSAAEAVIPNVQDLLRDFPGLSNEFSQYLPKGYDQSSSRSNRQDDLRREVGMESPSTTDTAAAQKRRYIYLSPINQAWS